MDPKKEIRTKRIGKKERQQKVQEYKDELKRIADYKLDDEDS